MLFFFSLIFFFYDDADITPLMPLYFCHIDYLLMIAADDITLSLRLFIADAAFLSCHLFSDAFLSLIRHLFTMSVIILPMPCFADAD